ncbi:MAG: thiamine-phosphate synthase [Phycisphaerae bacterium]|nr:MAG: thiamine-phosphate synthase [Phycisphaerae bacterium]
MGPSRGTGMAAIVVLSDLEFSVRIPGDRDPGQTRTLLQKVKGRSMDPTVARVIDANFNRAREALRVMEDYARFALDDEALAKRLKDMRHGLAAAVAMGDADALMLARDTVGDVGTTNETKSEYRRSDIESVVRAAGKRLGEALRVIEEYGKTFDEAMARRVEQLRYSGYDIEKELCLTMRARQAFADVSLYVLITEAICAHPWRDVIKRVTDAVERCCFQLREKGLSDAELLDRAGGFVECCRDAGAISIVNDRCDIAVASGADGVHVGQDDISVEAARQIVGANKLIGISTHSVEQARAAVSSHPDYIAVGPMFATSLKPDADTASPACMRKVAEITALPKVGIGGINTDNAGEVFGAGANCVSVCSAIVGSDDPAAVSRAILDARQQSTQPAV